MTAATATIAVVYPEARRHNDAIARYSERLVEELARHDGVCATLVDLGVVGGLGPSDVAILQYNPFSYGRWGFAPQCIALWWGARCTRILMLHEPYVPIQSVRSAVMGGWQRAQLAALAARSDVVFMSIEGWRSRLATGRRDAVHLPIGSLLPDRRADRDIIRDRLGAAPSTLVVGTLSTNHPSQLTDRSVRAIEAIAARDDDLIWLNLGRGAPRPRLAQPVRIVSPGALSEDILAAHLAAVDLFLAPFSDGVSTRRSSFMAAAQHGKAILATSGPLTDDVIAARAPTAWRLTHVDDPQAFVDVALELAADAPGRRGLGSTAAATYGSDFDWPVLTRRLLGSIGLACES